MIDGPFHIKTNRCSKWYALYHETRYHEARLAAVGISIDSVVAELRYWGDFDYARQQSVIDWLRDRISLQQHIQFMQHGRTDQVMPEDQAEAQRREALTKGGKL